MGASDAAIQGHHACTHLLPRACLNPEPGPWLFAGDGRRCASVAAGDGLASTHCDSLSSALLATAFPTHSGRSSYRYSAQPNETSRAPSSPPAASNRRMQRAVCRTRWRGKLYFARDPARCVAAQPLHWIGPYPSAAGGDGGGHECRTRGCMVMERHAGRAPPCCKPVCAPRTTATAAESARLLTYPTESALT